METILFIVFLCFCAYAIVVVSTVTYDLLTGRYKRLQGIAKRDFSESQAHVNVKG